MTTNKIQKHNERMKRHKEVVDTKIEQANIEQGIVLVITGNGKGKTTSALGTLLRSLGHGQTCALAQFIKGQWDCGESHFFANAHNNSPSAGHLTTFTMNTGFTWNTQDFEKDQQAAKIIWDDILPFFSDSNCRLIVLDELTYMFKYRYLDINEFIHAIKNRPHKQNIIITGRGAARELIEIADTVSEIKSIKHAFDQDIKAQEGIEW